MGTSHLREDALTEEHRSSSTAWGWLRADNPNQKNDLSRSPKTKGQETYRAVEPIMIMIHLSCTTKSICNLNLTENCRQKYLVKKIVAWKFGRTSLFNTSALSD
jgi:hypothetical protein